MKLRVGPIWLSVVFLTCFQPAHAQNNACDSFAKFYVKASLGYGISMNGDYSNSSYNHKSNLTISRLGNGIYYNTAIGYQYNNNIGLGLGMEYFNGFGHNLSYYNSQNYENESATIFQFVPSLVYTCTISQIIPYLRTGMIISFPEIIDNVAYDPNDIKFRLHGGTTFGLQSAIGVSFHLTKRVQIFGEASFNAVSYLPEKRSIYYYTVHGIDTLPYLPVASKEAVFKRNIINGNSNTESSKPLDFPESSFGIGSLDFNIGLKINLADVLVYQDVQNEKPYSYLRGNIGYGFATQGDYYYDQDFNNGSKLTTLIYSGGHGLNVGLGYGHMFNANIGFDLGVNFVSTQKFNYFDTQNPSTIYQSLYGNMVQFIPGIIFASRVNNFQPYARLGLIIGNGTVYYSYSRKVMDSTNYSNNLTWKYDGGVTFGYNTVLGLAYPISHNLYLFAEASFYSIYDIPEKGTLLSQELDGKDITSSLSTRNKEIVFKTSYNETDNSNPDKPMTQTPVKYSFNSVVANIGLRVRF